MSMQITISREAGEYETALGRAHLDVVRTGAGHGPNALGNVSVDGVEMFSGLVQFPVIGRTTIADDTIAVALMVGAPPGTRWCEIDVTPGDILLYGPGADHSGLSPECVEYRFALIDLSMVDDLAEELRTPILHPARGSVTRFNSSEAVRALGSELLSLGSPVGPSDNLASTGVGLVRATAKVLTDPSPSLQRRPAGRIVSRQIVNVTTDYADAIGRKPSIPELCIAAHVSERRLRTAFYDTFDMAPSAYLRTRFLSHARDRLLVGEQSVTEIALDLGFKHLGRFAEQYAAAYGDQPSDTLAAARSGVAPRAHRPTARAARHPR
jgi:AraC family ethanolamine operon transcriptional activator